MKRSPLKPGKGFAPRSKPMARGTSTLKAKQPMQRGQAQLARAKKPMKASRSKATPIRQSAKMESCTIRLPGICNNDPATVVWCHENSYAAGKGMGLKAKDEHGAYGCGACHAVYDGQAPRPDWLTKEQVDAHFGKAKENSRAILEVKGLL